MKEKNYSLIGFIGIILLAYGEFFPALIKDWSSFIIDGINESIVLQDSGQLMIISFGYAAKYTIIFFLIYFGSMMIAHAFSKNLESITFSLLFIAISMIAFLVFNQLYKENFSIIGAILTIGIVIFLQLFIPKHRLYYIISSIILFLVLLSIQWAQLIPALSHYGFGSSDIAVSIKIADSYFTANRLFNTLATIFFASFLTIASILTFLIYLVNKQLNTEKKYQHQEEELRETRIALVESKVYQEINTLVHDLKTPLVTVEGLVSLINMKLKPQKESILTEYFKRLDHSLDKMNDMISEILYENIKQYIAITDLLDYVTSHLGLDEQQIDLDIVVDEKLPPVYINKIRFSRAISNILENAITSFAGKAGYIHVHVKRIDKGVLFQIQDNGPGIKQSHLEDIWKDGFSTKNSSGIGLSFVKRVVENHNGRVSVDSVAGSHTQMNILLPIHKEGENKVEYDHFNS
ncbi:sensor histidine kinase [Virgibacillus oceani]|uniref:histidine kinase n=1 Tax=Virgibacillus oceani TaxID=1479511 RepID=A0A917H4E7_9BACI|nr:HAMP domain-containing sensor histidine kinase [Virgibacillus oceani]GGG67054.1 ATPase [Virgibacillus oceani]